MTNAIFTKKVKWADFDENPDVLGPWGQSQTTVHTIAGGPSHPMPHDGESGAAPLVTETRSPGAGEPEGNPGPGNRDYSLGLE